MSNRYLVLSSDINETAVRDLIESIHDINAEDESFEKFLREYEREPIQLVINSPGGYVDDGLALIGAIQLSKTPVHTIALGLAASMALYVLVSGHKRYMHRMATLMYHDVSTMSHSTLEQNRRFQLEVERKVVMMDQFLVSHTKIKRPQLKRVKSQVRDWYIDATEAVQLGIVDGILDKA